MNINKLTRGLGAVALLAVWGCQTLDVTNPNEPDAKRALKSPAAVEALGAGAIQSWFNAYTDLRGAGVTEVQARTYSSSWNNGNLNYHQGVYLADGTRMAAADTITSPTAWTRNGGPYANDPAITARTTIEAFWGGGLDESSTLRPGMYAVLSSANSVLKAIRQNNLVINNDADTKRDEAMAATMQGAALMMLSLEYDKAYIVDENTDLTQPLTYSTRDVVRDSAVSKLQQAVTLWNAGTASDVPTGWTDGGESFTAAEMAKIANTMSAMAIAWYARDSTEAAAVDWATVKAYAAQGITNSGCYNPVPGDVADVTCPGDWTAVGDGYSSWVSELMDWFNGMDGGRVHSRVAHFMDPKNLLDPYPLGIGSPTTWANHGDSTISVPASNQISRSTGSWLTDSIAVGDYVQLSGYKTAKDANGNYLDSAYKDNGFPMKVTALTASTVTVQGTPLSVTGSVDANAVLLRIRTPSSPDQRLGDGTFASTNLGGSYNNVPADAGRGTDFAWLRTGEIFRSDRGFYVQSNLGHMRYDASGEQDPADVYGAYGAMPAINWELNDLLWAEADIRLGGATNLAEAATLIDETRVGRGGLSTAAALIGTVGVPGDGPCMTNGKLAKDGSACTLWSALNYEYEIELLGLGPAPYWHQRGMPLVLATAWEQAVYCRTRPCTNNPSTIYNGPRYVQGLLPGTPREMPVPAKELGVNGEALYTWGGLGPANSPTP
jgi:hypothetical protein